MKLLKVDTVEEAKIKMDQHYKHIKLDREEVDILQGLGRIAAEDIIAPIDLPEFNRATVDGYALLSRDTFGASESIPVFLEVEGKVEMGQATELTIRSGTGVYVPTGGMIPEGADGVVMIEYVEQLDSCTIAVHKPVAPGEGLIHRGEDLKTGEVIIKKGRRIKPQDIGALAAVGINRLKVMEKPRIAILSTGDEIVDPEAEVPFGKIRDINTYALAAMAEESGCNVTYKAVIKDDYELLTKTMGSVINDNHIVILSGGSSIGTKDMTAKVIASMGEPGVFVHGVAVKPGKPTIIGSAGNTALFGLPGHPVSAMIVFKIFVEYLINNMLEYKHRSNRGLQAMADANIHSSPGKETYQMVVIEEVEGKLLAKPIHGKSGAISLMTRAQGYIKIELNKEGIKKGERVNVILI